LQYTKGEYNFHGGETPVNQLFVFAEPISILIVGEIFDCPIMLTEMFSRVFRRRTRVYCNTDCAGMWNFRTKMRRRRRMEQWRADLQEPHPAAGVGVARNDVNFKANARAAFVQMGLGADSKI
jgi:hypothetical protein